MNAALIEEIFSVLFQGLEAGIKYGPAILDDLKLVYSLAVSGTTLTPAQQAQADAAVFNAHQALQAQIATDAKNDAQA